MSLTKIGSIGINTGIQLAGVTTVATLHVGSGVTLSSDGDVFATGISTFSEDIKVGSGVTISPDGDGFYTGVVTATTFSGSLAASNLTGALPAISGANLTNLNASNISFTHTGTGATARTVDSKLEDVVSAKDFGALGNNSNDDTAELQAAFNAAAGKTLFIPKGIYLISKTLIIPEGTRIVGSGKADVSEGDYTKGTVIKTTGSGNAQVWTDIASGTDAAQTPCLVAGGNGVYIENLTVLTDANHWSIGILYPCVKQCSISKVSMRGFTNACLYLDASRSNLNKPTVTDQAGTSVTIDCGTGMNEFYAEDFIFRSNTNGVSDFGIKIQGTTRDTNPSGITYQTPTDSTTQSAVTSAASGSTPFWVWGWGGASDIVFNSGRTSGISIDGALSTNVTKKIQGQRFIAVDSRVSANGIEVNVDRATRVDFISGYGELNGKIKFSHRTGIVNFLFTAYTGTVNYLNSGGSTTTHGTLGSTSIVDADNSNTLELTVYTNDGLILSSKGKLKLTANTLSPEVNNAFTLGSSTKNFANVRTRKVEADSADLVLNSDNNKIAFFDGSTEGSISLDTNLVIDGRANETGLQFRASDIIPRDNGSATNLTTDLGDNSFSFRDVYARGVLFNGDSAGANRLDDYEEGTWTATITGIGGGTNPTFSAQTSSAGYVKVGNICHIWAYIYNINCTNAGSGVITTISGLPFGSGGHYYPGVVTHDTIITNTSGGYVQTNSTSPHFIPIVNNATSGSLPVVGNTKYIMIAASYYTQ